jgi:hypothetical protein
MSTARCAQNKTFMNNNQSLNFLKLYKLMRQNAAQMANK